MPKRKICEKCTRPCRACLCHAFPPSLFNTNVEILVVQTPAEARCKIATAWLLPHVLAKCKVIPPRDLALRIPSRAAVLFPDRDSVPIDSLNEPPRCIVVIDGTWDSAKRLSENCSSLNGLTRIHLSPRKGDPLFRVRRPPSDISEARSTAEAVADVIEALEGGPNIEAVKAVRHAVHEASEMQLRFVRQKGTEKVPHRTERRGYVPGLYEEHMKEEK